MKVAKRFLNLVAYVPVGLILCFTGYSYYVFVVALCCKHLRIILAEYLINGEGKDTTKGALYIAFFNVLILLVLPSFARLLFTNPGKTTRLKLRFASTQAEEEQALKSLGCYKDENAYLIVPKQNARFCSICQTPKPERSHHCSTCKCCILKMDHHCVWLNKCVGWGNYKYFVVFLCWSFIACGFLFGTLLQILIWQLANDKLTGNSIQFLIVDILSLFFALATFSLLVYHINLCLYNMTTIEHLDWQDAKRNGGLPDELLTTNPRHGKLCLSDRAVSLDKLTNWEQVFGANPLLWAIPVHSTPGSGIYWPKQTDAVAVG